MKPDITFDPLDDGRIMVSMPRLWWLYREFRLLFPRAKPGPEACVWIVAGRTMWHRLGRWDRRSGTKAADEVRRREQARRDAEWDAASRAADP